MQQTQLVATAIPATIVCQAEEPQNAGAVARLRCHFAVQHGRGLRRSEIVEQGVRAASDSLPEFLVYSWFCEGTRPRPRVCALTPGDFSFTLTHQVV